MRGKTKYLTLFALALGVLLLAWGIFLGDPAVVWEKATKICLECMGIG
ncbi:MAG: hypothetical protein IKD18_02260 [Clostridia bacterium]|nr:hypothetical protein [Clostridia bacterium]